MTRSDALPLVTIVIPARNEGEAIRDAIDRVAAQTYPLERIEVVVVDGDSRDETSSIAKTAVSDVAFHRAEVIFNAIATTPSNLNRGLEWASGELLVRVDSRSLIPPDYVARLVSVLSDPAVAVAGGSQVAIPRSGSVRDRAIARALNNRIAMGGSSYRRQGAPSGPVDTVYLGAFRTTQLRSLGGWNESFTTNQDFELNRRMSAEGHVWFESGLPVGYYGRRTLSEIWQQYHRFGRWKAHYWNATGDRPQPRQLALVFGPAIAGAACVTMVGRNPKLAGVLGSLALPGFVAMDAIGGEREDDELSVRALAGVTNAIVGLGWWTGVLRGLLSKLMRREQGGVRP